MIKEPPYIIFDEAQLVHIMLETDWEPYYSWFKLSVDFGALVVNRTNVTFPC